MKATTAVALVLILNGTASAQTVIWEASLTVEESGSFTGYDSAVGYGALSNTTFSYEGVTETVTRVRSWEVSAGKHTIALGLPEFFDDTDARLKWTLHIGSETFVPTDGTINVGFQPGWKWNGSPTWADGETVTVKLTTTYPGAPAGFTAEENDSNGTGVALSWTAPASAGAEPITKYQYRHGGLAYRSWELWTDVSGGASVTSTTVTMPYAWPDATYPFQLRAVSDEGDGLWSEIARASVVDERGGLQVSDTSAYEGYEDTPGGRKRNIGDTNMLRFDITIDPPAGAGNWIEVTLSTRDGTAVKDQDYGRGIYVPRNPPDENDYFGRWKGITHFRFEGSQTSQSVYVQIYDDHVEDSGETMELDAHIHRVSGLDWHDRPPPTKTTGIGTILNDEEFGQNARASVAGGEVREGDGGIEFTVSLSEPVSADVSVKYGTTAGSATAGEDYTATQGWIDFLGGETTGKVTVPIVDDDIAEERETFSLQLSSFQNVSAGSPSTAEASIIDDDGSALTAAFRNMPAEHDGSTPFKFEVEFTTEVAISYVAMRDHAFTIDEGDVTRARRVDGRSDRWEITVEPDGDEPVGITLPGNRACGTHGAICSKAERPIQLGNSPSATVEGPAAEPQGTALTASFANIPDDHDGSDFTFDLTFSEKPDIGWRDVEGGFRVSGGSIDHVRRETRGSNLAWKVTVRPAGIGSLTITLPETTECSASHAICTADGRKLSNATSERVDGQLGISIADSEVEEGAGARIVFRVSLSEPASQRMTVNWATSDGTATAGSDYQRTTGQLTFLEGHTARDVDVRVYDDSHDEGSETFTVTLSSASTGRITNATATGTITNHDALPAALTARFGRAAAVHVLDQVEERVNAPRAPGFDGRLAGRRIGRNMGRDFALDLLQGVAGSAGQGAGGLRGVPGNAGHSPGGLPGGGVGSPAGSAFGGFGGGLSPGGFGNTATGFGGGLGGVGFGGRDQLLGGSRFALNRETRGGTLSFWSRSANSSFHGQEDLLALSGDVRTTMFGADYARGRMVTGVSLSHSRGLGSYAGTDTGQVTSAVTGLYPWIGFKASERVTVWTVAGYGAGGLMLQPGAGAPIETGLSMAMAAGGGRGQLLGGDEGFGLAFKADALWVGMRTEARSGPGGSLRATQAAVTRLRTALEGSRRMTVANRLALTPSIELGIRQDGGDADVGRRARPGSGTRAGGLGHRPGRRPAGAPAARAPGGRVRRERNGDLGQLRPVAVDAAGLHGAGSAGMGRRRHERGRGPLGPRHHGRHGNRRGAAPRGRRRTPGHRGGLRTARRQPVRGDAPGGRPDVGVRPGLPARLRDAGPRGGPAPAAGRRRGRATGEPGLRVRPRRGRGQAGRPAGPGTGQRRVVEH